MDLSDLYFRQKEKYGCSAQSVAIFYNYFNPRSNLTDSDLLYQFPKWKYYINNGGIGIKRLSLIIDDLLNVESEVIRNPSYEEFYNDVRDYNILIYYNKKSKYNKKGHYTPVLKFKNNKIKIGESGSHKMVWVTIDYILPRLKGYIIF